MVDSGGRFVLVFKNKFQVIIKSMYVRFGHRYNFNKFGERIKMRLIAFVMVIVVVTFIDCFRHKRQTYTGR